MLLFDHLSYVSFEIIKKELGLVEFVIYLNKKSEQLEEVVLSATKDLVKESRIAEQFAIAGDKSDNIPGVPGIGMSTAGKLLKRFENLDQLFSRVDEIASMQIRGAFRVGQLIMEHKENILLSKI